MKESQKKANAKYQAKFDEIKIRVPKGDKEKYQEYARSQGLSLNNLVVNLLQNELNG